MSLRTIDDETQVVEVSIDVLVTEQKQTQDWKTTKNTISLALERILTQGIPLGMPSSLLEEAVSAQLKPDIPKNTEQATNIDELIKLLWKNILNRKSQK